MLKYSIFIVVLVALVAVVLTSPTPHHDGKHDHCHHGDQIIKKGESVSAPIGECAEYTCHDDGSISGKICALFVPAKGCKVSEIDKTKAYPDCCPKPIC